jgi:hypothetical protein
MVLEAVDLSDPRSKRCSGRTDPIPSIMLDQARPRHFCHYCWFIDDSSVGIGLGVFFFGKFARNRPKMVKPVPRTRFGSFALPRIRTT